MAMVTGIAPPPPEPITTIDLDEGYNLISLPLIPEDYEAEIILADVLDDVEVVAQWPGGNTGDWEKYWNDPMFDDFDMMYDGIGYFIDMDAAGSFDVVGYEIAAPGLAVPPSYNVVPGWNLIGFKSTLPKMPTDYLAAIDGMYTVMYGYENGAYFIVGSPGHEYLQPGLGYWIAMLEAGIVYP